MRIYRLTLRIETDRPGVARLETGTLASADAAEAAAQLYRRICQRYEATIEQHGATPTGYQIAAAALIRKESPCPSN
jgi:hypothetical protein